MCTEQTIKAIAVWCLSNEYTQARKINNGLIGRAKRQEIARAGAGDCDFRSQEEARTCLTPHLPCRALTCDTRLEAKMMVF